MELKVSNLLNSDISPFLHGAFFSRIIPTFSNRDIPDSFYVYSTVKKSKYVPTKQFDFENYPNELIKTYNYFSYFEHWKLHKVSSSRFEIRFYVKNDMSLEENVFFMLMYKKLIHSEWIFQDNLNEDKKSFIRGYMETRGSIDTSHKWIAQDYFYNNKFELKRILLLTDMMNLPMSHANFNPRNLQPEYVSGTNQRNDQFRIKLFYYANMIGFINKYKVKIFENAYQTYNKSIVNKITFYDMDYPKSDVTNVAFVKYLNFFTNNIYQKNLNNENIQKLRELIGFDSQKAGNRINRDMSMVKLFDEISEDKCAICDTKKTFIKKTNGRQSFDIHHMISFHNSPKFDNIANLVKLCPTCHSSLKKGRSTKENQIKSIKIILEKREEVYEYCSTALAVHEVDELSEQIWYKLG